MRRSAVLGSDCSLKNSLMPSARLWSRPNGPARSGPTRFCILAMTLRRNQMYNSTDKQQQHEHRDRLADDDQHDRGVDAVVEQRVGDREQRRHGRHRVVSTRSSVTAAAMSTTSLGPTSPPCANAMNAVPGAVAASATHRHRDRAARRGDAHVVALGAHPDATEVARVHDERVGGRELRRARVRSTRCDRCRRACGPPRGGDCTRRAASAPVAVGAAIPHVERGARRQLLGRGLDRLLGRLRVLLRRLAAREPGLDRVGAGAAGGHRAGAERRQVRLVGGDAGLDRLPRATGGDAEDVLEHDLVGEVGDRQHRAVARAAHEVGVDAGERGRDARDLVLHVVDGLEAEVDVEARRQLLRDAPVVHRQALGRDRAAPGAARDPRGWWWCRAFSPHTEVGRNTSARVDASAVNAPTATRNGAASSPARMRMRSGKSCSGSAPRSTSARMRARGRRVEDPGGVESALRWERCPTRRRSGRARRRA